MVTRSDAFNQVTNRGTRSFGYDGLGRMVSATGVTGLSYTGTGNTLAADGTAEYTRDPGGAVVGVRSGGVQRLVWTDQHTDVVGQFTSTGTALAGSAAYDPLGNVLASANLLGSLGYQSEWTDTQSGRVNMASRWYNPATGQFDSRDSASLSPVPTSVSANPFAYVNDNPLAGTDPTGQCSWYDVVCGAKKAVTAVTNTVSNVVSTVSSYASSAWDHVTSFVSNAWDSFTDTLGGIWDHITSAANNIYNGVKNAVTNVVKGAVHAVNTVVNKVKDAAEKAKQAAVRAANAVKQATANVVHTVTHYAQAATHIVTTAYHATVKAVDAAAHYVEHHAAAIASFVVSTAVFIGCDAAMGIIMPGAGAVIGATACGALAGAVGGAVGYAVGAAQSGNFSWSGLGKAALVGGIAGAAGGLLGGLGGKAMSWVGGKAAGALRGLLRSGTEDAGADAASSAATDAASDAASTAADDGAAQAGGHADAAPSEPAPNEPAGKGADEPAGAGCKHSFDPATPVLMGDGSSKPIKDVKLGDRVTSTDPATGKTTTEPVVLLHDNHDTDLADVTVRAADGTRDTLHTTWHHPFWNATRGTWTDAAALTPGTRLHADDGRTETVEAVLLRTGRHEMRDLTVAVLHTYYVIAAGTPVLVHNVNAGSCPIGGPPSPNITEEGLNHSFGRHAAQWFGRPVSRSAKMDEWAGLIERASGSSKIVPWSSGATQTNAYLARIGGKWFAAQFDRESGDLVTAFVPNNGQIGAMLRLLGKA